LIPKAVVVNGKDLAGISFDAMCPVTAREVGNASEALTSEGPL
jgi:hypothetical protein